MIYQIQDYKAASTTTAYTYTVPIFMLDIENTGASAITLSQFTISIPAGSKRTIYLGGITKFTITASTAFNFIAYTGMPE